MDIRTTYQELGSCRATAAPYGTTHKTVRRVVERRSRPALERPPRPKTIDLYLGPIAAKVKGTDGRISAKRLLSLCQPAGYTGSACSLRRAVAEAKAAHRRGRRSWRPWLRVPGEHLVIDWGEEGPWKVFCAVLAWSRWRFIKLEVEGHRTMRYELTPDAVDLGLGAAFPAQLETGGQMGGLGRGERGSASLAHLRFRSGFVLENVTGPPTVWPVGARKAG